MKKTILLLIFLTLSLFAQKPVIMVTIEPQKYFVEKIAKDTVIVKTVFKESNFEVKFKQLALKKLASSNIYMTMNLDIEKPFLEELKNINSDLEVFDISQDVKTIKSKGVVNPYIWTDPLKVRTVAKTIFNKLAKMYPNNRTLYEENYNKFILELDELYLKIKTLYRDVNFSIYALDSYWDYFAHRFDFPIYHIKQNVLDADEIPKFIKRSKKRNVRVILATHDTSRRVTKSISTNANARIVKSNIFKYDWAGELYLLAETIKKKSVSRLK